MSSVLLLMRTIIFSKDFIIVGRSSCATYNIIYQPIYITPVIYSLRRRRNLRIFAISFSLRYRALLIRSPAVNASEISLIKTTTIIAHDDIKTEQMDRVNRRRDESRVRKRIKIKGVT